MVPRFRCADEVLHPIMPFITEEIWHHLGQRQEGESISVTSWPKAGNFNDQLLQEASVAFDAVQN